MCICSRLWIASRDVVIDTNCNNEFCKIISSRRLILQLVNFRRFLRWRNAITLQTGWRRHDTQRRVSRARSTSFNANKKRDWSGGRREGGSTGWKEKFVRGYHESYTFDLMDMHVKNLLQLTLTFNFKAKNSRPFVFIVFYSLRR